MNKGANDFTVADLEALFGGESEQESPTANEGTDDAESDDNQVSGAQESNVEQTKAFAKRLRESTTKAVNDERESIAKTLGYDSYADMMAKRDQQIIRDKGLDPEQISPVIDEIVRSRIDSDPRMQELSGYKNAQLEEFARGEINSLKELTGGRISSYKDIPKPVLDEFAKCGSLTKAYMSIEGVNLVTSMRRGGNNGTTAHLGSPNGAPPRDNGKRHLTDEEKNAYRIFNPKITDKELNEKMVDN